MKARLEWIFEGLTAPIGFEQPMSVVNLGDVHRTSNVLMDWARGLKVQIWAPNQQAVTLKRLPNGAGCRKLIGPRMATMHAKAFAPIISGACVEG